MKEVLKKLNETRAAALNEAIPDLRARAGHEMRRRQAQAELPTVKAEFDKAFRKVGFPVYLSGAGTAAFIKQAGEEAEVVVVDNLLTDLRFAVKSTIGPSREFAVGAYTALIRELRQVGASLGLDSAPQPEFQGVEYVADGPAVDAIIDRYLDGVGVDFLSAIIEMEAAKKAEALTGDQPVVPVIIVGVNPGTATNLGSKVFDRQPLTVQVTVDEVTPEFVTDAFQAIKSKFTSGSPSTPNPKKNKKQ